MGLVIGWIPKIQWLGRPSEVVQKFFLTLLDDEDFCACWSEGNALIFALKEKLEEKANDFLQGQETTQAEADEILRWIKSLPWEGNYIRLYLNW